MKGQTGNNYINSEYVVLDEMLLSWLYTVSRTFDYIVRYQFEYVPIQSLEAFKNNFSFSWKIYIFMIF